MRTAGGVGRAARDGAATVFVTGPSGAAAVCAAGSVRWLSRAFACAFAALILRAFCLLASICSLVRFIGLGRARRAGCENILQ